MEGLRKMTLSMLNKMLFVLNFECYRIIRNMTQDYGLTIENNLTSKCMLSSL